MPAATSPKTRTSACWQSSGPTATNPRDPGRFPWDAHLWCHHCFLFSSLILGECFLDVIIWNIYCNYMCYTVMGFSSMSPATSLPFTTLVENKATKRGFSRWSNPGTTTPPRLEKTKVRRERKKRTTRILGPAVTVAKVAQELVLKSTSPGYKQGHTQDFTYLDPRYRGVFPVTTKHKATTYHSSLLTPHQWNQFYSWINSLQHNFPFQPADLDAWRFAVHFLEALSHSKNQAAVTGERPPSVTRKIRVRRVMRKIRKMRRLLLDPAESWGSWATISTLEKTVAMIQWWWGAGCQTCN